MEILITSHDIYHQGDEYKGNWENDSPSIKAALDKSIKFGMVPMIGDNILGDSGSDYSIKWRSITQHSICFWLIEDEQLN